MCRAGFDELVVYEMDELRDRPAGATAQRIHEGAMQVAPAACARIVLDVREAIRTAVRAARPGDVVVLGCASHLDELRDALGGHVEIASVDVGTLGTEGGSAQHREEAKAAA